MTYIIKGKKMIDETLLRSYGAVEKQLKKGAFLFMEGDNAVNYYQIVAGKLKMNNYNDAGQEMIQGLFEAGDSFGEPAILGDFPFPANGEVIEDVVVLCLEKKRFFTLLHDHPSVSIALLKVLSRRLRFKAMLSREVKGFDAEHRIMTLLNYLKTQAQIEGEYCVDITRQTIGDLTGLRVETVIRTIKILQTKGLVQIRKRKLYL
ncbi:MAG: Crp/Fnr family transcriptional regulator [Chitinophagales bacterium]